MRIRHLIATTGVLHSSPEDNPASGVVGAVLSLAPYQIHNNNDVEIWGWNPELKSGWKNWGKIKIWTSPGWSWAKFARWDLRWLAPVWLEGILSPPVEILHVHVDPNLLLVSRSKVKILHLQNPVPVPTPQIYFRLLKLTDSVICCSEFIRQQFCSVTGYDFDRTAIIYNGADPDKYRPEGESELRSSWGIVEDDLIILYAGALTPEKGVDYLIKAFSKINNPNGKFHLVIAGSGGLWKTIDQKQYHEEYVQKLMDLAHGLKVKFLGSLPRSAMYDVYSAADIVCVPSVWDDPHPTVVCEAMAAGKPVVAFQSGGITETIQDGETGYLVPKGDIEGLRNRIDQLLHNYPLRMMMSQKGKDRAKKIFSWKRSASKLDELYDLLISKK